MAAGPAGDPRRPKILIYAPREEPEEVRRAIAGAGCDLVFGDRAWTLPDGDHAAALGEAARGAAALMGTSIRHTPITREVMAASPDLRIVAKYSVGVDDVDLAAATEMGILVCHAPTEANCFGVAENTVAMMLALLKRLHGRDAAVRSGRWREKEHSGTFLGKRASDGYGGITVGLVGLGRIGTRVAQLLAPWHVRLLACDPYLDPAAFLLAGVEHVDYETLLEEADVVSFHVVLTDETRGMLSDREIGRMKKEAIVINTARGFVVNETALARAVAAERLGGAALDAFAQEPLSPSSPLLDLDDRILLSPHAAAFNGGEELKPGILWATRSVLSALAGKVPDNVYNKAVIPVWRERFGDRPVTATTDVTQVPRS